MSGDQDILDVRSILVRPVLGRDPDDPSPMDFWRVIEIQHVVAGNLRTTRLFLHATHAASLGLASAALGTFAAGEPPA